MMTRSSAVFILLLPLCLALVSPALAQDPEPEPVDTLSSEEKSADTAEAQPPHDSTVTRPDSLRAILDSLGIKEDSRTAGPEKVYPPTRLIDTLIEYFSQHRYRFDVQKIDLFPETPLPSCNVTRPSSS